MAELRFTRLAGTPDASALLVVGPSLGIPVAALWAAAARLLAPRFEVVGWDLPGHGGSPPAGAAFTVGDLADDVRQRAAELAVGRPASYAGVSLGGAVGFALALDPGPFVGVAALASAPRLGDPEAWHERAAFVRKAGTPAMVEGSTQRWFAPGFLERDPSTGNTLLLALCDVDDESYSRGCEALASYDLSDRLDEVAVPLLIVAGEYDQVVAPDAAHAIAAAAPGSRVSVLPGVAHLPPAEAPAATADLLTTFLLETR